VKPRGPGFHQEASDFIIHLRPDDRDMGNGSIGAT